MKTENEKIWLFNIYLSEANAGKSTLFNALTKAGSRVQLTHHGDYWTQTLNGGSSRWTSTKTTEWLLENMFQQHLNLQISQEL